MGGAGGRTHVRRARHRTRADTSVTLLQLWRRSSSRVGACARAETSLRFVHSVRSNLRWEAKVSWSVTFCQPWSVVITFVGRGTGPAALCLRSRRSRGCVGHARKACPQGGLNP